MNETHFEPYGSLLHPDWRESGVQLTGKQAVLLMHDIYIYILLYICDFIFVERIPIYNECIKLEKGSELGS